MKVVEYLSSRVSEYFSITLRFFTTFIFDSKLNFNQNMIKVHLSIKYTQSTSDTSSTCNCTVVEKYFKDQKLVLFVKQLQIKSIRRIIFLHLTATQNGRRLLIFVEKCQRLGWGGGGASTERWQGTCKTATSCVTPACDVTFPLVSDVVTEPNPFLSGVRNRLP